MCQSSPTSVGYQTQKPTEKCINEEQGEAAENEKSRAKQTSWLLDLSGVWSAANNFYS